MKVRHEHVIDAPVEKVMATYADKAFYVEKLKNSGAISVDVVEHAEQPGDRVRWKAKVSEPSRFPAFLRKSDVDTYVDDSVLDRPAGTLTWKVTPAIMADKFFLSGLMEFRKEGKGTRLSFTTRMDVKIPLVGGKAESIGLSKTEEEVARQVAFLRKWLAEH
ncbi:MAG: DUF2505 domain-containing protein [Deltaproteobacteria bacterium]|nr:DUF2505 domain-containing protein [Deltaproteobacteria bacterium]